MILTVSERTDIPAFYSEWFMNRIREGVVVIRNPFQPKQLSSVPLTKDNVDFIIFITKNARPLTKHLDELTERGFQYGFHYSITAYHKDIEVNVTNKRQIIENFKALSNKIGKERMVLRYDPILINDDYTVEYHIKAFEKLVNELAPYMDRVYISFIDLYDSVRKNIKGLGIRRPYDNEIHQLAHSFSKTVKKHGVVLETCAEVIDLSAYGIEHGRCIDGAYVERVTSKTMMMSSKQKYIRSNHRATCDCHKHIDVGDYNCCLHECVYCYANHDRKGIRDKMKTHNLKSPVLLGDIDGEIKQRKEEDTKSFFVSNEQMNLFE